jgi:hypothetical protein
MNVGKDRQPCLALDVSKNSQSLVETGARNERSDVRFALSYDALKMNGTPARRAMSTSRAASSFACASLSITHGPAMSTSGAPPPIRRSPSWTGVTCTL